MTSKPSHLTSSSPSGALTAVVKRHWRSYSKYRVRFSYITFPQNLMPIQWLRSNRGQISANADDIFHTVVLAQTKHNCSHKRNILPRERLTRPKGPILGARADVAPTSPPVHLRYTGKRKMINASVEVGGRLTTIPVSTHRSEDSHATFRLFFKTAPRASAESRGRPPPPRCHHLLKRGPLQAPRGTAAFGTATSAEAHTEPARTQPNRQPTKWGSAGDKPYPKACGLQSRHRSSGPPSPFARGEAEAQKE